MLILIATIILILIAIGGWLFLKSDSDRYIHEKSSPINFFFKWGRPLHHFFKVAIIILFMIMIFSFYKYPLNASNTFSLSAALVAGIVLSGGKELLDKKITLDDIFASVIGITIGFFALLLFF